MRATELMYITFPGRPHFPARHRMTNDGRASLSRSTMEMSSRLSPLPFETATMRKPDIADMKALCE